MKFYFKHPKPNQENAIIDSLIFCKKDLIFELNFITQQPHILYNFQKELSKQPYYFRLNKTQNKFIVSSNDDALYVDLDTENEIDID